MSTDGIEQPQRYIDRAGNVYALLAARARRASVRRLQIDAAFGGVALATAPFLPTLWWALASPIVIVGAYGVWGLADRGIEGKPRPWEPSASYEILTSVKWLAVAIGTSAAVVAMWGFMRAALSNWIS